LKFCARLLTAFGADGRRHRSVELYARGTPTGVGLGEVCHSR
jgi:hypothetical protein